MNGNCTTVELGIIAEIWSNRRNHDDSLLVVQSGLAVCGTLVGDLHASSTKRNLQFRTTPALVGKLFVPPQHNRLMIQAATGLPRTRTTQTPTLTIRISFGNHCLSDTEVWLPSLYRHPSSNTWCPAQKKSFKILLFQQNVPILIEYHAHLSLLLCHGTKQFYYVDFSSILKNMSALSKQTSGA